ncbi:AfsR/SARP family transcriptional regulator [Streptomyces litchfieldiae]|uniref:BTAD domain-containing putative transcriptional regulator n=1 Tax=Streptomyces litchfieldiae TaxID=3075543 RepID=A0ABU2MN46_9ACTN|nr:BTAD domain-containing putative transcriptional regulator [Streptomyces sp. DSM 44938]MDT0342871.1 BTAD domain-containing putative transcriptional regulator [Streptomyces sp. DSM 44938]
MSVLGPLEVVVDGRPVPITARRAARLLAALVLAGGKPVGVGRLIECVWGDRSPPTAEAQLQTVVWRLRLVLAEVGVPGGTIRRTAGGYLLPEAAFTTDLGRFRAEVAAARAELGANRPDSAAAVLRSALARWRAPALLGIGGGALATTAERLEEERQGVLEQRLRLEVLCGRHRAVVAELREQVDQHPLRESLACTLAMALYRSGRVGDALGVIRRARARLRDDLGMDPGRELPAVERAILRQSTGFTAAECRAELRQIQRALEG